MKGHLRKRKTKKGTSWQIVLEVGFDAKGKRTREYRTVNGTKKEAETLMLKLIEEMESGVLFNEGKISVKLYLQKWLNDYVKPFRAYNTFRTYAIFVEEHIAPALGHVRMHDLKPTMVQSFYNSLISEKNLAPATIRVIHAAFGAALKQAVRLKLIRENPATGALLPKLASRKAECLSTDELVNLLEKVKGDLMEIPVTLAATLGMRNGETVGLTWSCVDLENLQIRVEKNLVYTKEHGPVLFTTKTESGKRVIDIPDGLAQILKKHKIKQAEQKLLLGQKYTDNDLVCCYPDGRFISPQIVTTRFGKFLVRAGLREMHFHDLRHSNATLMLKMGTPAKIASARLGHKNVAITLDLYSHVLDGMQRETANNLDATLFGKECIQ